VLESGAMTVPLLRVEHLIKYYADAAGRNVLVVNDVSFDLAQGEMLGVVGESGCGKTTLARMLVRLLEPTAGKILLEGRDLASLRGSALKTARRDLQMVFQDPFGSLNPRHTIGHILAEPLIVHGADRATIRARVGELLAMVGLPAASVARYPHEFSGGQRQRIAIARALALKPKLIIADEPVSALDVSIQSQIINLISELREQLGLSMIFISHDLSVVRHVSSRVAVMKAGAVVEMGPADSVFTRPQHAYTQALLAAIPKMPV
jgi:ABC-type glutathione transport system ATPase component